MVCYKQDCGAVVKITLLRPQRSSHENGSSSGALVFVSLDLAPELYFFMAWLQQRLLFVFHINNFNGLGVPHVEWKMQCVKYKKTKRIY